MPQFSDVPLPSDEAVDNWLKFFEVDGPFTNFSVFVNRDPVRLQKKSSGAFQKLTKIIFKGS